MCGGGPLFGNDDAHTIPHQSAEKLTTTNVVDPLVLSMVRELRSYEKQAKRDYHSLRGYIDSYRARADSLESQVRTWCDEIDESVIQHDRTVNSYVSRYNHLETEQDALLKRIRVLEHTFENRQAISACSKACYDQDDLLWRKMRTMDEKIRRLEDQGKDKDKKIDRLSALCDTLRKRAAKHERDVQDSLASALSTSSETAGSATAKLVGRLTSLAQTIDLHRHYFDEIRDRVIQQETTTREARDLIDSFPQGKGLEDCIEKIAIRIYPQIVSNGLQELRESQEQWTASIDDRLSQQVLASEERYDLLKKADKMLDSRLSKSKKKANSALAEVKSSFGVQIAAHKDAADDQSKSLIASFNDELIDFAKELQVNHLTGMKSHILQHADLLQQLQSQHDILEAGFRQQTTDRFNMTMFGPIRPDTPRNQSTPVPT